MGIVLIVGRKRQWYSNGELRILYIGVAEVTELGVAAVKWEAGGRMVLSNRKRRLWPWVDDY